MRRQQARHMHLHRPHLRHLQHPTPTPLFRHTTQRHMRARHPQRCRRGMRRSRGTTTTAMAATVPLPYPKHRHSSRLRPPRPMVRHSWHRGRHRHHNQAIVLYRRVRVMRRKLLLRALLPTTRHSTRPPRATQDSSTSRRILPTAQVRIAARLMRLLRDTHTRRRRPRRLTRVTRKSQSVQTTLPRIQIRS